MAFQKRPNRSPKPIFDASPTAPSTVPETSTEKSEKQKTRTRRDEEETMDVVAAPLYIVGDPEAVDVKSPDSNFHHPLNSFSEKEKTRYCVDKVGIIALAIGFALLSTFAVSTAMYILVDVICSGSKRKKGLIANVEPRLSIGSPGRIRPLNSDPLSTIEIPRISRQLRIN